jgi:hypothetical protein
MKIHPVVRVIDSLYLGKEEGRRLTLACGHTRLVGANCFKSWVRCHKCPKVEARP